MTLLRLRIVELSSFFIIIFVAKFIANFSYDTPLFLALFVTALALHVAGPIMWETLGTQFAWPRIKTTNALSWYSSVLDFLVVMGLIYLTGTIESPFLFLLVVPLFFAGHVFARRIAAVYYLVGAIGLIAFTGCLELWGVIPHFSCYFFADDIYRNTHYYIGSLLVLGGFLSLILFLTNAFHGHFHHSMDSLRKSDKESKKKLEELSRLYDISLGINAVMTVETLLKMVAKEATLLLSQPWASIVLVNPQREITHSAIIGIPESYRAKLGSKVRKGGLTEWLCENGKPMIVNDVLKDERAATGEFLLATKIRSLIGLPLSTGQQVIGVIYVGDFCPKEFEDKCLRRLTIMSDQLAIAIAKSKLYESIQRKMEGYEKQVKDLKKVNQLKSEYVAHVSHELRTPLTSIKAYMETLENNIDDPGFTEKKDFLKIVSKETERLIRIVNDILDVSNIEFGQKPLQRSTFDVVEIIHEVVAMLQPKLAEKHMTAQTILPEHLPMVDADKDLITQVFINLITNAVKYSPEGSGIRIKAAEDAVDLRIAIEDEGIGIPEGQLEKIFDKYYRVKSRESKEYDGVGLGLAIVRNIIEQHGGVITVESTEQVGSKFMFTIPKKHCVNDLIGYISENVDSKPELHEMLNVIVRMVAELLSAKIISLMLLDKNRQELFIKVSYGLDEWIVDQARVKVGEGIAGKVAETGMPLLLDNIESNDVYSSPNNPQYETMSLVSVPLIVDDVIVGVVNVNNKTSGEPFNQDDMNLLMSFAERISKALERLKAAENSGMLLQGTSDAFQKMLDKQIQTKSIEQLVNLAVKLSRRLGLSEKEVKVIQYVASVHDIGMTKVSDDILNKTFNLTPEEVKQIETHPHVGTELIRPLEFVELVSNIILHHHERVDGLGYPMGLKTARIPMGSRILAVIDAYQSMTSERPYRERMSAFSAVTELAECAGKQFDAEVVEAFVDVLEETGKLYSGQAKNFRKRLKGVMASSAH
jgi:K+-sensing histidine kinase KdpD